MKGCFTGTKKNKILIYKYESQTAQLQNHAIGFAAACAV